MTGVTCLDYLRIQAYMFGWPWPINSFACKFHLKGIEAQTSIRTASTVFSSPCLCKARDALCRKAPKRRRRARRYWCRGSDGSVRQKQDLSGSIDAIISGISLLWTLLVAELQTAKGANMMSLVSVAARSSSEEMISFIRVGMPENPLRTKLR